ncbi:GNAT family N-acetyltransferase [Halobacteria archaeon AArc-curdl1]|uniref:GNAT family N-acetyltransferase n=1 Tax=Natronosalvus hydrolyticus TaxID=2979988 RepID=A0AAP3E6W0_9EURY|nr:GNAT family N-acetyltransferase [Halobacteria archaeon AArc-curdl1]
MSSLQIRPAQPADAARVARLYRQAYGSAADLGFPSRMTEIDAETVGDWLEADARTLLAFESDGARNVNETGDSNTSDEYRLVGTVRLLEESEEPYLERLAVRPDRQGEGIASTLVDRMERYARNHGYDCIQLTTFDDHPFLLEWYRERGYEPIKHHDRPERSYDFVTMEKALE